MKKLLISVYFIVKNEEDRFPTALKAIVDWVDEIIVVVDPRTTDKTVEIAESYGAKVIFKEWKGYAAQKAFAAKQCKNDWVFNLDADEEVSVELKNKLHELFGQGKLPEENGFLMKWVDIYPELGRKKIYSKGYYILRLYRNSKGGLKTDKFLIDDRPRVYSGKVGKIDEPTYHRSFVNFSQMEAKFGQYSQEHAIHNVNNGRKVSNLKLFIDFPFSFFKEYFIKRMFLQGWYGLTISIMTAYRTFMRMAKTRELYAMEEMKQSKIKKTGK
ncbi:MAG: glycosyltransferase family 2 protein [Proteobacteria bacterium]|nr:glycosyltransferase family 2 protein [Pseudomonadota bacterium]